MLDIHAVGLVVDILSEMSYASTLVQRSLDK